VDKQGGAAVRVQRRRFLQFVAGVVALPLTPRFALAEDYPIHPVHLVVGFAPGSTTDILARLMAQWLSQRLGQQVVVDNRPGAGGNIGAEFVVKSPPDGYTLIMVPPAVAANDALYQNLNFNFVRDIAAVAGVVRVPNVAEVYPSLPVKSIDSGIDRLRQSQSGQTQLCIGTPSHLAGQLFNVMTGANLTHIP
jgi:tripartite-type tricarboxylate transporter receptor subunit TctC